MKCTGCKHEFTARPMATQPERCRVCIVRYPIHLLGAPCVACGRLGDADDPLTRTGRHDGCKGIHARDAEIRIGLDWDEDPDAWWWVRLHPRGATHREVGEALGLTFERVRQIEAGALRKLRATAPELVALLTGAERRAA